MVRASIWRQHPQAPAVDCGASGGFTQVVPQVPSVCHLNRLGRPGGGAFGEVRCPIAADHFDGRFASQAARLEASRSGSRSTGRRLSTWARTVP